jgi:hypothetical protein
MTTNLVIGNSTLCKHKLIVKLDYGCRLLVLSRNERGDATPIAVRVSCEPSRFVVVATVDLDRITNLQHARRHADILA